MTDLLTQLERDEAVAEKASPGPWEWDGDSDDASISAASGGCIAHVQHHGNIRTVDKTGEQFSHADAAFIAHFSPDYVLKLIAVAKAADAFTRVEEMEPWDQEAEDAFQSIERALFALAQSSKKGSP